MMNWPQHNSYLQKSFEFIKLKNAKNIEGLFEAIIRKLFIKVIKVKFSNSLILVFLKYRLDP